MISRSRYLLYKSSNKWTNTQQERTEILFKNYPDIEKAYNLCLTYPGFIIKQKIKLLP
ncbi:transposase [Polaribacter sp. Z014]|uniref:transposase n=1 Tax=Polaribacter sp. Z014 TaxID=2927126 RepID=UPI0032E391E5